VRALARARAEAVVVTFEEPGRTVVRPMLQKNALAGQKPSK